MRPETCPYSIVRLEKVTRSSSSEGTVSTFNQPLTILVWMHVDQKHQSILQLNAQNERISQLASSISIGAGSYFWQLLLIELIELYMVQRNQVV